MNPNWMNEQSINLGEKNSFLLSLVTSLGEIKIPTQPGHQPWGNKFIPTLPGVPGHQPLKDMEFPSQYFY